LLTKIGPLLLVLTAGEKSFARGIMRRGVELPKGYKWAVEVRNKSWTFHYAGFDPDCIDLMMRTGKKDESS